MEFRTFQTQWGAEFISHDVVRFRVWAEGQKEVTLRLTQNDIPMMAAGGAGFRWMFQALPTAPNICSCWRMAWPSPTRLRGRRKAT